jgi:hypothetical protein
MHVHQFGIKVPQFIFTAIIFLDFFRLYFFCTFFCVQGPKNGLQHPCLSLFLSHFVPPPLLFLVYSKVSLCLSISTAEPLFFSFISWPFYPQMKRRKFPSLFRIPFLSRYCGPDLRQATCEFKYLYFWRNCRKSNLFPTIPILQFLDLWDLRYGP